MAMWPYVVLVLFELRNVGEIASTRKRSYLMQFAVGLIAQCVVTVVQ